MTPTRSTTVRRSYSERGSWLPVSPLSSSRRRKVRLMKALKVMTLIAVVGSLALFGLAGWNLLCAKGTFAVRHMEILNISGHPRGPVLAALKPLEGKNLWEVKPERVAALLSGIPWIEGFTCRKHLPNTLVVEVKERKGLAAAVFRGNVIEIDGAGGWWKAAPGTRGRLVIDGELRPSDAMLQKVIVQLESPESPVRVVRVSRSGETGTFVLRTDDGWNLLTEPNDLDTQLGRFAAARKWAEARRPDMKTMDVRWRGKVVLSHSGSEPDAAGSHSVGKGGRYG